MIYHLFLKKNPKKPKNPSSSVNKGMVSKWLWHLPVLGVYPGHR